MKNFFSFSCSVVALLFCFGQKHTHAQTNMDIDWQSSFGTSEYDVVHGIDTTSDGGYIFCGSSVLLNGTTDCFVTKIDSLGTIEWQQIFGGTGQEDCTDIQTTSDGGYIVCGTSDSQNGTFSGCPGYGGYDVWVLKLNANGILQWQKKFGGTSHDLGIQIEETTNGYVIGGHTQSGTNAFFDVWVFKIDSLGILMWQHTFGGTENENLISLRSTNDAGFVIGMHSMSSNGTMIVNHGGYDASVIKIDSLGTTEWQHTFGADADESVGDILQVSDGGYVVSVNTTSDSLDTFLNQGGHDVLVSKITSTGSIEWQKMFGGTGGDFSRTVLETCDHTYLIGGYSESQDSSFVNYGGADAFLWQIDSLGVMKSQKNFGGTSYDEWYTMKHTSDNGYVSAGNSRSSNGNVSINYGDMDVWIVKVKPFTEQSLPYISSSFTTSTILQSIDTLVVVSVDTLDSFIIVETDSVFEETYLEIHQNIIDTLMSTVSVCNQDTLMTSIEGETDTLYSFETVVSQYYTTTIDSIQILPVLIESEIKNMYKVHIAPNPSQGSFFIDTGEFYAVSTFYDIQGVMVLQQKHQGKTFFNNSLTPGIYMVKSFFNDTTQITSRIIITQQ